MKLFELIKRNIRVYIRDKGAVFFSLMSMLIIIALMLFFLGDMYIDETVDTVSLIPGRNAEADRTNAAVLILQWIAAGIMGINAVTVTMAVYSSMIKDRTEGKLNSIYTAPVSRLTISASYIISAWICSVVICILTLAIAEIYIIMQGGEAYSLASHIKLLGAIGANSFTYASVMYLAAMLSKTQGAWSGIGTVIGTLVGFLGGIYLPIGNFSGAIEKLMKCTPVMYGAKLFRSIMTEDAEKTMFEGVPSEIVREYRLALGTDLEIFGPCISDMTAVMILVGCGVVFMMLGALVTSMKRKSDR